MLSRMNLAQEMLSAGLRYEGLAGSGSRRILAQQARGLTAREAHRRVIRLAAPSVLLLTPLAALLGFALSWVVARLNGPDWLQATVGFGISFVPAAVGLSLSAFLWALRLRGRNAIEVVLLNHSKNTWWISSAAYLLALGSAFVGHQLWPELF